jgi:hypothetical protein
MHIGRQQFRRANCSGRKRLMSLVHEPGALELMQINADIGAGAIVMLTARMVHLRPHHSIRLGPSEREAYVYVLHVSFICPLQVDISTHGIAIGEGVHSRHHPHQWDVANRQQRSTVRGA